MGWFEAADLIVKGMEGAIKNKTVTYDFERLMAVLGNKQTSPRITAFPFISSPL